MTSEKNDKKINRSKKLLANAFFELLEEKPGEKISVKALCERADYSRQTFYAHFYQIEDVVYYHYEKEWLVKLAQQLDDIKKRNLTVHEAGQEGVLCLFEYWTTQIETYKLLRSIDIEDVFLKLFEEAAILFVERFYTNPDAIFNSVSGKCILKGGARFCKTVYDIWMQSGTKMNNEKMATMVSTFYINLFNQVAGFDK